MSLPIGGIVDNLMIGTMFFKYKDFGWSEKYVLQNATGDPTPTYAQAVTMFLFGCIYRSYLMGLGVSITYARISKATSLGDSVMAIYAPILSKLVDAESTTEKINSAQVNALMRMDNLDGKFATRQFRGLRDSWVTDHEQAAGLFSGNPGDATVIMADPTPALYTKQQAVDNFILWMKQNTVIATLDPSGIAWHTYPMKWITFRKIGSRDTGRPFGTSRGRQAAFA